MGMENKDKPFVCVADGCNLRFANENHLSIHKKKHDMVLHLENEHKSNMFVADQTPTPTRFIRTCEEVGLFQDLQNVNPFDETFRKAVEGGKSGIHSLHVADSLHSHTGVDDTLHTPHVYIPIEETPPASTANVKQKPEQRPEPESDIDKKVQSVKIISEGSGTNQKISSSLKHALLNVTNGSHSNACSVQMVLQMPDGKLLQLTGLPVDTTATQAHVIGTKPSVVLATPSVPGQPTSVQTAAVVSNSLTLAKMKLKDTLTSGRINSKSRDIPKVTLPVINCSEEKVTRQDKRLRRASSGGEEISDKEKEKRQRALERNRVAAMRCREKRKTQMQELDKRCKEMQEMNVQLQNEITQLRSEVAQLKSMLLAHKDCPITQMMSQGFPLHVPMGSELVTSNSNLNQLKSNIGQKLSTGLGNSVKKLSKYKNLKPAVTLNIPKSNITQAPILLSEPHKRSTLRHYSGKANILCNPGITSTLSLQPVTAEYIPVLRNTTEANASLTSTFPQIVVVTKPNNSFMVSTCIENNQEQKDVHCNAFSSELGPNQVIKVNPSVIRQITIEGNLKNIATTGVQDPDSDIEIISDVPSCKRKSEIS